jgi:hypothetical protein
MDYDETEYVNAHIDYAYRYNGGGYFQQLFKLPGDNGRVYRVKSNDERIVLSDTNIHSIKIEISDAKQNTSVLNFNVQYSDSLAALIKYNSRPPYAPGYVNVFEQNDFEVYLPDNCLYDSMAPVFFRSYEPGAAAVSSQFQFCDASIPVHGRINVRIKPTVPIPDDLRKKIVIRLR